MELLGTCVGGDYAIFLPLLPVSISTKYKGFCDGRAIHDNLASKRGWRWKVDKFRNENLGILFPKMVLPFSIYPYLAGIESR
jgi:hypothetical protein